MENLTVSEKIRILAARKNVTLSELARRIDKSPANFLNQLKADNWRVPDLEKIAAALGLVFVCDFIEKDDAGRG